MHMQSTWLTAYSKDACAVSTTRFAYGTGSYRPVNGFISSSALYGRHVTHNYTHTTSCFSAALTRKHNVDNDTEAVNIGVH